MNQPTSRVPVTLPYIDVRDSGVHGLGAFAAKTIPSGTVIGDYAGRRYGADEIRHRNWDHDLTHVFGLSDGGVIDGAEGGNATQYLNHSCSPNCEAQEIEGDEGPSVIIVALRRIARGAELSLDYGLDVGDNDPADYPCRCGVLACRKTLVRTPADQAGSLAGAHSG